MRTLTLTQWLFAAYAAVAVLLFGVGHAHTAPTIANTLLILAPVTALIGCFMAVRAQPRAVEIPWIILSLAAVAQIATRLTMAAGDAARDSVDLLSLLSYAGCAGGIAWLLHQRDRERGAEIVLDAGLTIGAAALATLRWSPTAHAMVIGGTLTASQVLGLVGTPVLAASTMLLAIVFAAGRAAGRGRAIGIMLLAGAGGLALASLATMTHGGPCCTEGDGLSYFFIIGWTSFGVAGSLAAGAATDELAPVGEIGGRRLRLVAAPLVGLVLAAVFIDALFRAPLSNPASAVLAALSLLLALRVSQLLFVTQNQSSQQIELTQSRLLIEVSQALAGTTDLDATLAVVTKWACRLLNARAAAIELLDESGEMLELRAAQGFSRKAQSLRFPVQDSFTGWVVREGRPRATSNPRAEADIPESFLEHLGDSPMAAAPLRYHDRTLGALSCTGKYPFDARDLELLRALADQAAVAIENARLFHQVRLLSLTDALTGLPNRRQLERDLAREFAAARRGRRLVAIMFDLNGFKEYNDRYGHLAGDAALRRFAQALAHSTRAQNTSARYGGDEFIALVTDADRAGARVLVERVRADFPGPDAVDGERTLSVAAGIAEYTPSMKSPEDLVEAADRELYQEKRQRTISIATSQTFDQPAK